MICYLVRHGKDDDSVRGGWSDSPLTDTGVLQVRALAEQFCALKADIDAIYTSDLPRAKQTAEILSATLRLPVCEKPEFRETHNGLLAGMDNTLAAQRFHGLYWSALDWEECYPGGESPCTFYQRVSTAWSTFKQELKAKNHTAILVTHGGVINVIRCIENGIAYSNKVNPFPMGNAEMVGISI